MTPKHITDDDNNAKNLSFHKLLDTYVFVIFYTFMNTMFSYLYFSGNYFNYILCMVSIKIVYYDAERKKERE